MGHPPCGPVLEGRPEVVGDDRRPRPVTSEASPQTGENVEWRLVRTLDWLQDGEQLMVRQLRQILRGRHRPAQTPLRLCQPLLHSRAVLTALVHASPIRRPCPLDPRLPSLHCQHIRYAGISPLHVSSVDTSDCTLKRRSRALQTPLEAGLKTTNPSTASPYSFPTT